MPGAPLSKDLKERIVKWYYEDQDTMAQIASQARCSIGTVSNVLRVYREYGDVKDPFRQYTGRPSKLSEADLKFLDAIVVANPSLYLDEIQQRLHDVREVDVSIATLARALAALDLTRKEVSKAASERDEELRTLWEVTMAEYNDPQVFVALDESAVDRHTGQREIRDILREISWKWAIWISRPTTRTMVVHVVHSFRTGLVKRRVESEKRNKRRGMRRKLLINGQSPLFGCGNAHVISRTKKLGFKELCKAL